MESSQSHDTGAAVSPLAAALLLAVAGSLLTGALYAIARSFGWTLGWIYLGLMAAAFALNSACLLHWNPTLIRRRMRIGPGTKRWDVVWSVVSTPVWVVVFVVAVIDLRAAASSPGPLWLLGMALFLPGWGLIVWSMSVNPFFEKTVRIQTELGHHVIDHGPYALVRHPGYVGFAAWLLSAPLLLGAPSALLPASLAVALLVVRTGLEDRTLHAELSGYPEYAERVRYRLIPGVW